MKVSELTDDYYTYYEDRYEMVGRDTGKILKLGDKCRIKVINADKIDRVIDFEFVQNNIKGK